MDAFPPPDPNPAAQAPPAYAGIPAPAPYGPPLGKRRAPGLTILITIVTCGVWSFVWAFQNGDELQRWSGKGLGGAFHLIITIFVSPVTMFLLAGEVEQLYRDDGQEPPITTLWGLWFLLPLIGNIIWYLRIQDAINAYWTAHGQTNQPSL
jgi:hypothetical protein